MEIKIIIAIIGSIIAVLTYYNNFHKKPNSEIKKLKDSVLVQFMMNRNLSIELTSNLENFASKTDSYHKPIFSGITFENYILQLKDSQENNLSESLYNNILETNYHGNEHFLNSMYDSLKTQYKNLELINAEAKIKLTSIK